MDQAGILVHAEVDFHAEVPLVAILGLMHLRIALASLVLGGAGRRDQGGVHDPALSHRHAMLAQMSLDGFKDLARPGHASPAGGER